MPPICMGDRPCTLHRICIATTSCTAMLRPREATSRGTAVPRAGAASRFFATTGAPPIRPRAAADRAGHGAASGRLLRRACDELVECCAGVRRLPSARGESAWESMGWWQGWAGAHRGSSIAMSAHEDIVATVALQVVLLLVPSSGPSAAVRCIVNHLQVQRVAPTRRHLHGSMENRELHRTMGLRLAADGLRELQPRWSGGPETSRVNFSDPGLLHVDPLYNRPVRQCADNILG